MSERIENLKLLIERGDKCRVKHTASTIVKERYKEYPVWGGVVETFELQGHPTAKRAYAWVIPPESKGQEPQYTRALGVQPINSPQDAVKADLEGYQKPH